VSQAYSSPRKRELLGLVAVLGLVSALCLLLLPGATDAAKGKDEATANVAKAKKKKKKPVRVMTQNLYLGSDLTRAVQAANEGAGVAGVAGAAARLKAFDHFANEVGVVLQNVQTNDFAVRARNIAKRIKKNKADLVGLQEAALWRLQIPTDGGGPSPANPTAGLATTPLIDYIDTLLGALNAKAMTKKQCKKKGLTGDKCYRGYRLVVAGQEADIEQPGDFDNNPGPNGIGGEGPAFTTAGPAAGTPPCGNATFSTQETNPGADDTGVFLGDPGPPNTTVTDPGGGFGGRPVPFDWNGDSNTNTRHGGSSAALNCGPDTLAPHVFGTTAPPYSYASDCPDNNPLDGMNNPVEGAQDKHDTTSSCLFHGIDGDGRLTMRDAVIARKGAGVKTSNATSGHYGHLFSVPVFNGASQITFTRGWTALDASVRGQKFHLIDTHLESESAGTFREDQASELVTNQGAATHPNTVLVGDLNSDPNIAPGSDPNADSSSNIAYNRIIAGGYRSLSGPGNTDGHAEILNNPGDNNLTKRIDHILTNSSRITMLSTKVLNKFANGLWGSDHAGVLSVLRVKKK
jgi:endonuclease/exonuclease/phosphatase family metal-dependent hydrolase